MVPVLGPITDYRLLITDLPNSRPLNCVHNEAMQTIERTFILPRLAIASLGPPDPGDFG